MYKILLSVRKDNVKPLFTTYKTKQEVIIAPAILDENDVVITPAITETQLLDWSCELLTDLEAKVDELLDTYPITDIIPFKAVEIDAVISAKDGDTIGE